MNKMKLLLLLLSVTISSYGQNSEESRLAIIESQMQTIQKLIQENSTKGLYTSLDSLIKQKNQVLNTNDTLLEAKIQKLHSDLSSKEQIISDLQKNLSSITVQINSIVQSEQSDTKDKIKAEELAKRAQVVKDSLNIEYITKFKSFILTWHDLGSSLAASTITTKTLLLFPNAKTEPIWQSITKYAGIVGGIAGPLMYSSANNPSEQKNAVVTTGVSLSVTGLVSLLFKNKNSQTTLENIGRNVAFTDDVKSIDKIAMQFSEKATEVWNKIKPFYNTAGWKPNVDQLNDYYSLIALRRDLAIAFRQIKSKAEFLKTQAVTEDGKGILDTQIKRYQNTLDSWEGLEAIYLDTYQYLNNIVKQQ